MVLDSIIQLLPGQKDPKPNKFTIFMGEAIRTAREEANLSQERLAELIYRRRATLSDIENGKVEVDASTLWLLSAYLKKPLSYFYPPYARETIKAEEIGPLEHELLLHFEQVYGDELKKLAIRLIKVMGEFDPDNLAHELAPIIMADLIPDPEDFESRRKRRK